MVHHLLLATEVLLHPNDALTHVEAGLAKPAKLAGPLQAKLCGLLCGLLVGALCVQPHALAKLLRATKRILIGALRRQACRLTKLLRTAKRILIGERCGHLIGHVLLRCTKRCLEALLTKARSCLGHLPCKLRIGHRLGHALTAATKCTGGLRLRAKLVLRHLTLALDVLTRKINDLLGVRVHVRLDAADGLLRRDLLRIVTKLLVHHPWVVTKLRINLLALKAHDVACAAHCVSQRTRCLIEHVVGRCGVYRRRHWRWCRRCHLCRRWRLHLRWNGWHWCWRNCCCWIRTTAHYLPPPMLSPARDFGLDLPKLRLKTLPAGS